MILKNPKLPADRILVNHQGYIQGFPGIVQGDWVTYIKGGFDFYDGRIGFRTSFERKAGGGFRCYWEIQPDGRYWGDNDGFGMEDDVELILYADLDDMGEFEGPFRIYEIGGKRVGMEV